LTQYEEAYIEKWVNEFNYGMDVIEVALKRTTYKNNPSFEYINNIITDWHDRNLKTPAEITAFLEKRKQQNKDEKELKNQVKKETFEQRQYENLDFLYANYKLEGEANG
jgi:DnaD/phage-associated family protein